MSPESRLAPPAPPQDLGHVLWPAEHQAIRNSLHRPQGSIASTAPADRTWNFQGADRFDQVPALANRGGRATLAGHVRAGVFRERDPTAVNEPNTVIQSTHPPERRSSLQYQPSHQDARRPRRRRGHRASMRYVRTASRDRGSGRPRSTIGVGCLELSLFEGSRISR